jgi:hypothetical protein
MGGLYRNGLAVLQTESAVALPPCGGPELAVSADSFCGSTNPLANSLETARNSS